MKISAGILVTAMVSLAIAIALPTSAAVVVSGEESAAIVGGCNKCVAKDGYCWLGCVTNAACQQDTESYCTAMFYKYKCQDPTGGAKYGQPCVPYPNKSKHCGEWRRNGTCDRTGYNHCSGGSLVSDDCPGNYATGDPC